jgi:hypothetical protein
VAAARSDAQSVPTEPPEARYGASKESPLMFELAAIGIGVGCFAFIFLMLYVLERV